MRVTLVWSQNLTIRQWEPSILRPSTVGEGERIVDITLTSGRWRHTATLYREGLGKGVRQDGGWVMLAQGRALYRSARLNAPLVSLLERRKASSFRLQTAAPFCLLRRELRRCETHAKLTTWFRNVSQNRSANNGLEINSRTENSNTKETPVAVPRKLRLQQDEYDLDENGYLVVEELVSFLRKEGALDMCVIEASGNRRSYVDYFVVVSGASTRHIRAMAKNLEQLVRKNKRIAHTACSSGADYLLEEGGLVQFLFRKHNFFKPSPIVHLKKINLKKLQKLAQH